MKKNRIIYKRTDDFWAGFKTAIILFTYAILFLVKFNIEAKMLLTCIISVYALYVYSQNKYSRIFNIVSKIRREKSIKEFSVAMEYSDLEKIVDDKKRLEKIVIDYEINEIKKTGKSIKTIWKN